MPKRFFLIMLITLTLGAAFAGANPALNGRWVDDGHEGDYSEFIFDNGNWEMWLEDSPFLKGTYTTTGGMITMQPTHLHSNIIVLLFYDGFEFPIVLEPTWYSRNEILPAMVAAFVTAFASEGGPFTPEELAELEAELGVGPGDDFAAALEAALGADQDSAFDEFFGLQAGPYSISGNTLTITFFNDTLTLTRRQGH